MKNSGTYIVGLITGILIVLMVWGMNLPIIQANQCYQLTLVAEENGNTAPVEYRAGHCKIKQQDKWINFEDWREQNGH